MGPVSKPRFLREDPRWGGQTPASSGGGAAPCGRASGGDGGRVPGSCTREVGEGPSHGGAKPGDVVQEGKDAPGLEGACGEPEV